MGAKKGPEWEKDSLNFEKDNRDDRRQIEGGSNKYDHPQDPEFLKSIIPPSLLRYPDY